MSNYNYNNYRGPSPGPGPGGTGPGPGGGSDPIETISWIIDIALIFAWFPIGLFLTIMNAMGRNFVGDLIRRFTGGSGRTGSGRVNMATGDSIRAHQERRAREADARAQAQAYARAYEKAQPGGNASGAAQSAQGAQSGKDAGRRGKNGSAVMTVVGWILVGVGLLAAFGSIGQGFWLILSRLAISAGGGALLWTARKAKRKEAAFRRCMTVTGDKGVVKLKGLAATLGMTEEELEKQLTEMLDDGWYGDRAYLDHARGLLVIEPEFMRDVYKAEDEAKATAKQREKRAARTEYEKIIDEIEEVNREIADEAMSEKIATMQEMTAAIFQEVEAHPEKKPQIQRFMNYYLPTTLKMLKSYARIEAQGVSGANMAKAKADIESIADTLVEGYKKQLDTLYRSEAVDIAGDVSLIDSMMKRDGLAGDNDFAYTAPRAPEPQTQTQPQTQTAGGSPFSSGSASAAAAQAMEE